MAEIVFRCPGCGFAHKIDSTRVPPAGIRGTCRGCSSPLTVFPDGRAEGHSPAPEPSPAVEQTVLSAPARKLPPIPKPFDTPRAYPPPQEPPEERPAPRSEPLAQMEEPPPAPPAEGLVAFRCPYCGAAAERPRVEIDGAGTRSVCGTCVQFFLLYPDGRTVETDEEGSAPVPAPARTAPEAEAPAGPKRLFGCPFCGAPLEREVGGMGPGGMEVACAVCVQLFRIFPDGRVEEPPAAQSPWEAPAPTAPKPAAAPPAPDPKTLLCRCPVCGREIHLPREKVPAAGVRGKCAGCQTRLLLHPDGTAEEAAKAAPAGDLTRWFYRLGADELGPFTVDEVGELVRTKVVGPQTALKPAGGEWASAAAFAVLAPLLAQAAPKAPAAEPPPAPPGDDVPPPAERLGDLDHCHAHPDRIPSRSCSECLRYLCDACVVEKPVAGMVRPLKTCAACGGSAVALPRRVTWTPFYLDMPNVLMAPLRGHALLYLGILAFLEVLKVPVGMGGVFGCFGLMILSAFQWSYLLNVTREVANGSYAMPLWPDVGHFSEIFFRFLKVLFVTVVAFLPVLVVALFMGFAAALTSLAGTSAGGAALLTGTGLLILVGGAAAGLFYLFYLPMCIGIVAVFDTVVPALNPVIIFRIMRRIGLPWALAAVLWFSLFVLSVGSAVFLKLLPYAGVVLGAVISTYTGLLFSYTLGRVFAENDHKIGWS